MTLPENESVPGGNLGHSNQQQATTRTTIDNGSPISPFRVTWLRRGWTQPRERGFESEASARTVFESFLRDQPAPVVTLDMWLGVVWRGWTTRLALCGGIVYDSATLGGARRIRQVVLQRDASCGGGAS